MASVVGSVAGGDPVRLDAETVQDVYEELNLTGKFTATVDGETVDMNYVLSDDQFVCFAPAVKGGASN